MACYRRIINYFPEGFDRNGVFVKEERRRKLEDYARHQIDYLFDRQVPNCPKRLYNSSSKIDGRLFTGGWAQLLRDICPNLAEVYENSEGEELNGQLSVRPDAWMLHLKEKHISIFEIEDSHPMELGKIDKYFWLSEYVFECSKWRMSVYTTNRYGSNINEIDLDLVELPRFSTLKPRESIFE